MSSRGVDPQPRRSTHCRGWGWTHSCATAPTARGGGGPTAVPQHPLLGPAVLPKILISYMISHRAGPGPGAE